MKDAKQLKRELDHQINQLPDEQLQEVLDLIASLSSRQQTSASSIEEKIEARLAQVSEEVLDELPSDASENLDHYLYGAPKK